MQRHQSSLPVLGNILLVATICFSNVYLQLVEVSTDLGNITGTIGESMVYVESGKQVSIQFVQYLGIPYAEPPVGELRFAKPVPKQPWNGTHNGTIYGPMCHQSNGQVPTGPGALLGVEMSEDCLTLDIYVPYNATTDKPYAVMIYLFGDTGASRGFVGDALVMYNEVVVIIINFRTHLMGYFSTGDSVAPGNYGLWDQKLALHWVKDHIENFGGDPDRISLIGFSMGGSNAILQALHTGNRDIVKRVVALSGTPFPTYERSSFLQQPKGDKFVESIKCVHETSEKVVKCLRSKTVEEINEALISLPYTITFTPVVDGDFVLADPQTILSGNHSELAEPKEAFGSIDLIVGLTNKEGGTHVALMWSELLNKDKDNFEVNATEFANIVVPTSMDIVFGENVPQAILQNVVLQYAPIGDTTNKTKLRKSVVDLSTDIDVAVPIVKTARYHSLRSSKVTLLYQFSASLSLQNSLTPSWLDGANHGDDVYFLFGFSDSNLKAWKQTRAFVPTTLEIQTSRKWMTIITNFVKTGNSRLPEHIADVPEWQSFTEVTSPYLDISHEAVEAKQYFREPQMTFWTKIVPALLQLPEVTENDVTCETPCEPVNELGRFFKIDLNTAENIILSFIIMSGCLLIAVLLICSLSVSRDNSVVYRLKTGSFQSS